MQDNIKVVGVVALFHSAGYEAKMLPDFLVLHLVTHCGGVYLKNFLIIPA